MSFRHTRQNQKRATKTGTAIAAPAPKSESLAIALQPKHLAAAIKYRDRAALVVISDKASDEGAQLTIKEGKELRKKVVADWKIVKDKLNGLIGVVRGLEAKELEAVDAGLTPITNRHIAWKEADDARIAREAQAERDRKEERARKDREKELQRQEDAAAELEAASDDLSARELWFVTKVVEGDIDIGRGMQRDVAAMERICKDAGYKDPAKAVERLIFAPKIVKAIASTVAAKAIREQAQALREEPIAVTTTKVESNTAKVPGLRHTTNYSCEAVVDVAAFIKAYRAGELDDDAMKPNLVFLNKEADRLKDKFEQAYPGARLKVTKGVAG